MKLSLVNGIPQQLDIAHRGLAYGDGLFETILVDHRGPQFLQEHLKRLEDGVAKLGLNWGRSQHEELLQLIQQNCTHLEQVHSLKLMLLRQYSGRGYDFDPQLQTTDVVFQLDIYQPPAWVSHGAKVVLSASGISENINLAGLKHLNRLDSVLARQEARKSYADDALMLDQQGNVIESSMCNVFFKVAGHWHTPKISTSGVNGIIRQAVLKSIPSVSVSEFPAIQLNQVDAAVLTNSLIGAVPVIDLVGKSLGTDAYFCKKLNEIIS